MMLCTHCKNEHPWWKSCPSRTHAALQKLVRALDNCYVRGMPPDSSAGMEAYLDAMVEAKKVLSN